MLKEFYSKLLFSFIKFQYIIVGLPKALIILTLLLLKKVKISRKITLLLKE